MYVQVQISKRMTRRRDWKLKSADYSWWQPVVRQVKIQREKMIDRERTDHGVIES